MPTVHSQLHGAHGDRARAEREGDGVSIGLLYSQTGNLSVTETSAYQGALLAVDEVNAAGGVWGRPLVPLTSDYESDCTLAVAQARKLAANQRILACIGGYTSASRVAIQPAVHAQRSLLIYPTYFEGLETDSRTFYAGAAPSQFLIDYVNWILTNLGRRIYILGSDYVYPRALATIIRSLAQDAGALIAAERYVPLGETDFSTVLDEITATHPDVIVSNVVGTPSTSSFYQQFRQAGNTADRLPIAATVTSELDLHAMGPENGSGHFMAGTYFSSLDNAQNRLYVRAVRERFGADAVAHVVQVGAYNAVWMLALAAERASDLSPDSLRDSMVGVEFRGNPEGWPITARPNHYTDHPSYIGYATTTGQFDIVAEHPVRAPDPYPPQVFHRRVGDNITVS